jgi:hypothetical protein
VSVSAAHQAEGSPARKKVAPLYLQGSAYLISLLEQGVDQSQQCHSRKEKIQSVSLHREFHDGHNQYCKK